MSVGWFYAANLIIVSAPSLDRPLVFAKQFERFDQRIKLNVPKVAHCFPKVAYKVASAVFIEKRLFWK